MDSFKSLLTKWNSGIERGAQLRFSKAVGATQQTVGRWINGEDLPRERFRPAVAKELKISVAQLMDSLNRKTDAGSFAGVLQSGQSLRPASDHMVPIRKEIYDMLSQKRTAEQMPGSTDLYIESLLLGIVREEFGRLTKKPQRFRVEAELDPLESIEQVSAPVEKKDKRRKSA